MSQTIGERFQNLLPVRYQFKFFMCLYGWQIDLIFFIYNIGDSMLDACLRPNMPQIVCFNMYPDKIEMCKNLLNHPDIEDDVQKVSTTYIIYYKVLSNAPALILGFFCGAWSDKYGRKLPMVMPSIGATFAVLLYMGANVSPPSSIILFLFGSLVHGCFGKTSLISMAVHSYIVDITETERRTRKLGLLASMQFLGMFIGSLLAGVLLDNTDILTTYCIVSLFHSTVVILSLAFVKETVTASEGTVLFPCRSIFQASNFKDSLMVLVKKREDSLRKCIIALLVVLLLHQTCRTGLIDVTLLYTELPPLSWPSSWFGYLSAADNAAMGIVLLILLPILSNVLKLSDSIISIIGLACASIRFVILAWSKESWMVWVAIIVGSLGGLINSPIRSLLSKFVHEDEIGKIFAVLGSWETVAKFLALVFTALYGSTIDIFPGFSFVLASGLYTIMVIIILLVHVTARKYEEGRGSDEDGSILPGGKSENADEYIELNHTK